MHVPLLGRTSSNSLVRLRDDRTRASYDLRLDPGAMARKGMRTQNGSSVSKCHGSQLEIGGLTDAHPRLEFRQMRRFTV